MMKIIVNLKELEMLLEMILEIIIILYESRGNKHYELAKEYLIKIRPYLQNMIRNYMSIREWKIQLTISTRFISPRNPEQSRIRHSNSENIEIMSGSDVDEAVNNLLLTLRENYSNELTRMERIEHHFGRVALLKYKVHKKRLAKGGSYIDSTK